MDTLAASLVTRIATTKENARWIRVCKFKVAIDHIRTVYRQDMAAQRDDFSDGMSHNRGSIVAPQATGDGVASKADEKNLFPADVHDAVRLKTGCIPQRKRAVCLRI